LSKGIDRPWCCQARRSVLYSALNRDWSLWRRLHLVGGLVIFLAIAAPWFIAVSLRNNEFFDFFLSASTSRAF
jgi:4-amino-4-deoxy-L-arabinose transferase-like glycosyltransferase